MRDDITASECFASHVSDFSHISLDKKNGEIMIDRHDHVIDFDGVKDDFIKRYPILNEGCQPQSVDGLFNAGSGKYLFIEFKNGNISGAHELCALREKAYHSILIFMSLTGKSLEWIRDNISYVLVYNYGKNEKYIETERMSSSHISQSVEIDKTTRMLNELAGNNMPMFRLNKLMKFSFRECYTLTAEEFVGKYLKE